MDVKRKIDIVRVNPQDWPDGTPAWKEEDPDLGSAIIPAARYTSEAFMKLEWERMWTKAWLLGGRSDDMAEPGDYICTEIGKESVLIVRQASLAAFFAFASDPAAQAAGIHRTAALLDSRLLPMRAFPG